MTFTFPQKLELAAALARHLQELQDQLPALTTPAARARHQARIHTVQAAQITLQRLRP